MGLIMYYCVMDCVPYLDYEYFFLLRLGNVVKIGPALSIQAVKPEIGPIMSD